MAASNFFTHCLDWCSIVSTIETFVLEESKSNGAEKRETVKEWVDKMTNNESSFYRRNLFMKYSIVIVQKIASKVKGLIQKIDKELEIFCLKLNKNGWRVLHLIA